MIERVTYTTQPSAQSMGRYITVYAPDGSYVSRHINMEECTESALAHAQAAGVGGTYRFVPPEKHMSVQIIKTIPGIYTGEYVANASLGRINAVGYGGSVSYGGGSGVPYDLSANSIPFDVTWPTAPSTTNGDVSVSTIGDLQTYSAAGGYRITIAAGTYNGNVTIANDTEWVMNNSATLTGSAALSGVNRFKWTGGNHFTTGIAVPIPVYTTGNDFLFDNVHFNHDFTGVTGAEGWSYRNGNTSSRHAWINCTMEYSPSLSAGEWGIHTQHQSGTSTYSDFTIANCRMNQAAQNFAVFRLNPITNLVLADSLINDQWASPFVGPSTGARFTRGQNVYYGNTIHIGYMFTTWSNSTNPWFGSWAMQDMTVENLDHYFNLGQFFDNDPFALGTNVISNSTLHTTAGAGTPIYNHFTNGGGNSRVAWDGTTIVYDNMAGKTSASDYGADH